MSNNTIRKHALFILGFFIVLIWLELLKIRGDAVYFALSQSILILATSFLVNRVSTNIIFQFLISFICGWVISFITSLILEAIFITNFYDILDEYIEKGVLVENLFNWFLLSLIYMGQIQAVFAYWVYKKK